MGRSCDWNCGDIEAAGIHRSFVPSSSACVPSSMPKCLTRRAVRAQRPWSPTQGGAMQRHSGFDLLRGHVSQMMACLGGAWCLPCGLHAGDCANNDSMEAYGTTKRAAINRFTIRCPNAAVQKLSRGQDCSRHLLLPTLNLICSRSPWHDFPFSLT